MPLLYVMKFTSRPKPGQTEFGLKLIELMDWFAGGAVLSANNSQIPRPIFRTAR